MASKHNTKHTLISPSVINSVLKMATEVKNVATKTETGDVQDAVIEPKSGVSFATKLDGSKQLQCTGLMKKNMFGIDLKIYAFGIYADNDKLKKLLKSRFGKAPEKPSVEEVFQAVVGSDVEVTVKMVFVFAGLPMGILKSNFDETLGEAIMKVNDGQTDEELAKSVMAPASDYTVLSSGSVIEISRLPGYILQTKVLDEVVSSVHSELLCRAGVYMYIGQDPTDTDAKEAFGISLLSLL